MFRVPWQDDHGGVHINRGFRIEMNSAIGPYKGGLRLHPSVNLGILKFLAFEQVFKNSLTTLPMGGGKGGSDFDPKGKSDNEVMRFCQSFMSELFRHIGPNTDVPAGDIGVGGREIGFLFGQYKRLAQRVHRRAHRQGAQLGRLAHPPRSHRLRLCLLRPGDDRHPRPDARMAKSASSRLRQRLSLHRREATSSSSTSGPSPSPCRTPTATSTTSTASTRSACSSSWSSKNVRRGRIKDYADKFKTATYTPIDPKGVHNPLWDHKADCAFPSATQNEINGKDAANLLRNGVYVVGEGANMPTTIDGVNQFLDAKILYGPGKAANAGGVATSGLEMAQNSMRYGWSREEVDDKLHRIMKDIHKACVQTAERFGTPGNYVNGANIAGFLKVADAMMDQGLV